MFDTSFDYSLIQKQPGSYKYILYEHIYQFYTSNRRYIAIVEEYEFHVYIVKFYPAERKRDPNRYSLVMNDFEFAPIIRTCINIMLQYLNEDAFASFGYIGANSITRKFTEPKAKTQRYRIYDYVMSIFLDTDKFERIVNVSNSGVLLLNKDNSNLAELKTAISNMFIEIYPDLENDLNQ